MLPAAVRALRAEPVPLLLAGAAAAAVLAGPDVARQVAARRSSSRALHLGVRAVGFLSSAAVQVRLVGVLAERRGTGPDGTGPSGTGPRDARADGSGLRGEGSAGTGSSGTALVLEALRQQPVRLVAGLFGYGALGGLLTLPVSLRLFGTSLVTGPLREPTLRRLCLAEATNATATTVSAPLFALHVLDCAATR